MTSMMQSLGIDKLSIDERLQLIDEIWDSIADTPDKCPLTPAQKQEIDQRLADLEANPDDVMTWDEVKARIRKQQ